MLAAKHCIPTERFVLTSNAHHFIPNRIVQKIWGMCSILSLIFSKQSSFLFSILTRKTTNVVCRALHLKRPEITFLWNSLLNKKSQIQSRGKSGLSLQRVNFVSWCKSRKSVRSDAFTGNWHKSRPTQYVYCCNWTCFLPCMLGIWGNFKGLFPCLRFTESGSLWRLTTAVTTFLECLLGWLQWRNPNHIRNERATRAKMPQRSREQIPTPQSVVVVANWSRGVPRRPCSRVAE